MGRHFRKKKKNETAESCTKDGESPVVERKKKKKTKKKTKSIKEFFIKILLSSSHKVEVFWNKKLRVLTKKIYENFFVKRKFMKISL